MITSYGAKTTRRKITHLLLGACQDQPEGRPMPSGVFDKDRGTRACAYRPHCIRKLSMQICGLATWSHRVRRELMLVQTVAPRPRVDGFVAVFRSSTLQVMKLRSISDIQHHHPLCFSDLARACWIGSIPDTWHGMHTPQDQ